MVQHLITETEKIPRWMPSESAVVAETQRGQKARTPQTYPTTLVIIPTYNEQDNLPLLVRDLLAADQSLEILVVDDGSPDGTGEVAERLGRTTGRVAVIHRTGKLGLGTAYVRGFRYALEHGYDQVVQMDADFSHRPGDLPRLLAALRSADAVVGSRYVPGGKTVGWPRLRGLLSRGGSLYARLMLGLPLHDCTGGYRCFRRRALEALDLDALQSNGFGFQIEVAYALTRAGMRLAEVPIVFPNRTRGQSKMSPRIILEAWLMVLRLRLGLQQAPLAPKTA